jgi:hypothetical protein
MNWESCEYIQCICDIEPEFAFGYECLFIIYECESVDLR